MISPNKENTTPERVEDALDLAYRCGLNLARCAEHCGMTIREFKMTFREYLKRVDEVA